MKAPLAIHVISHKDFKEKELYENAIYSTFNRDIDNYLERNIGIPVYTYRDTSPNLELKSYDKNIVVILVDSKMILDDGFSLKSITKDKSLQIIPIAVSRDAFKKDKYFEKYNLLRAYSYKTTDEKLAYILFELAHDISKYLLGKHNLKIFLSHAKVDGEDIAIKFKCYIETTTRLSSFFDVNDIQNATNWAKVLKDGVDKSIFLAFQTDKYASRPWCRKEILRAKELNVPIVVVNMLESYEDRSFPYMTNVPTVTVGSKDPYQEILFQLLLESVRSIYQKEFIKYFMKLFFPKATYNLLSNSPELLTLAFNKNKKNEYIYPDPPLGIEELELLKEVKKNKIFLTPLLHITKEIDFNSLKIAISVSESSDIEKYGLNDIVLRDFIIELTRYLLSTQSSMYYGGDIAYGGYVNFAKVISDLAKTYQNIYDSHVSITNYVAEPYWKNVSGSLQTDLKGIVDFKKIKIEKTIQNESEEYITSETLSKMRKQMNEKLDVRIIAGGKIEGFSGKYPGILEETYLALKKKKAVFLVGAFGGATRKVIDALEGKKVKEFSIAYQLKNDKFKNLYKMYEDNGNKKLFQYKKIVSFLNSHDIDNLNNGLTVDENRVLFESKNIYEILFLILKGISSQQAKSS